MSDIETSGSVATSPAENAAPLSVEELLQGFFARKRNTNRAYTADLATFREFLQSAGMPVATDADAAKYLLCGGRGRARVWMARYVEWLGTKYDASWTVHRKVSSLRSLLRFANDADMIEWSVKVALPPPTPVRDTRGPERGVVESVMEHCRKRGDAKGLRDLAMVSCMAFGAYRASEVLSLDVGHLDLGAEEVAILAKARSGRVRVAIPKRAAEAIIEWLAVRGEGDGPLFPAMKGGGRMSRMGLYSVCHELGQAVGYRKSLPGRAARRPGGHPHAFRHFAATESLRLSNGNVPLTMALLRHRDPRVTMVYADRVLLKCKQAQEIVAAGVPCYRLPDGELT